MKRFILFSLLLISPKLSFSQIAERDFDKAEIYENRFAEIIDSTQILSNDSNLVFSHNEIFRCIHLENKIQDITLIEIRYLDNHRGYTELYKDFKDFVIFKVRGDGANNPPIFLKVEKDTGEKMFLSDDEQNDYEINSSTNKSEKPSG